MIQQTNYRNRFLERTFERSPGHALLCLQGCLGSGGATSTITKESVTIGTMTNGGLETYTFKGPAEEMHLLAEVAGAHLVLRMGGEINERLIRTEAARLWALPGRADSNGPTEEQLQDALRNSSYAKAALLIGLRVDSSALLLELDGMLIGEVILAAWFHGALKRPLDEIVRSFKEDPETVSRLLGNWTSEKEIDDLLTFHEPGQDAAEILKIARGLGIGIRPSRKAA